MNVTSQDWLECFLLLKSIGFVLFAFAYVAGYMALLIVFLVGVFQTAELIKLWWNKKETKNG